MTKKDYVLIADSLIEARRIAHARGMDNVNTNLMFRFSVNSIAETLQRDNPRFSDSRFRNYIKKQLDSWDIPT